MNASSAAAIYASFCGILESPLHLEVTPNGGGGVRTTEFRSQLCCYVSVPAPGLSLFGWKRRSPRSLGPLGPNKSTEVTKKTLPVALQAALHSLT